MSRWKYLAVALVACMSLRTATTVADEKPNAPPPTAGEAADQFVKINKELKSHDDQIKALKDELAAANKSQDLLGQEITRLKEQLQTLPARPREDAATQKDLKAVWDDIDRLSKELSQMRSGAQRSSAYGPPETRVEKRDLGPGQIRLINSWNRSVGVTLDGVDYLLRPGQARTITRNPGSFTYEIHDVQGPKTMTLSGDGRPQVIEILGR